MLKIYVDLAEHDIVDVGASARIVKAPSGRLWVAYFTTESGVSRSIYTQYSDDNGVTWSDAQLAATNEWRSAVDMTFDLVVTSDSIPHLIYEKMEGAHAYTKSMYHTYWSSITEDWTIAHEDILNSISYYLNPRAAVDSNDNIHVVYNKFTGASASCRYVKGVYGSWGAPVNLDTEASRNYHQYIEIDSSDNPHVLYFGSYDDAGLKYTYYTGSSWRTPEKPFAMTYSGFYWTMVADFSMDSSDNLHVFVRKTDDYHFYYLTGTYGSWSSPLDFVASDIGPVVSLACAINALDELHVCWGLPEFWHRVRNGSWADAELLLDVTTGVADLVSHNYPSSGILATGFIALITGRATPIPAVGYSQAHII